MELSALEIALFTGILGVGATLLGVVISYYLSLKLAARQERKVAGAKLRAAFVPYIAEYTLMGRVIGENLWRTRFTQAAAVEEYRIFVPPEKQRRYQKIWEQYYKPMSERGGGSGPYAPNEVYMERIKEILKFAE